MLFSPELVVPCTERTKQLKEKSKVKIDPFNAAADLRKQKAAKEKRVQPVQPTWAPNIPKSKSVLPSSSAGMQRPVSLKGNKDTKLAEDAELLRELASVASVAAALDPVLPAKEAFVSSMTRKAVDPVQRLPNILRRPKSTKMKQNGNTSNAWNSLFIFYRSQLHNIPLSSSSRLAKVAHVVVTTSFLFTT
jgi:hypothetical protein